MSEVNEFENEHEEEEVYAFPASFAQERLWFVDQMEAGTAVYNVPYHHQMRWQGELNVPALAQALTEIVWRHEPLRTTFMNVDGEAVQVIQPEVDFELPIVDLTKLAPADQEAQVRYWVDKDGKHSFDLENGPLFFVRLLKLSDTEHVFIMMMHHIIVDGVSFEFFADELKTLYAAFAAGQESPLEELPLQYADFVIWQREWIEGKDVQRQLDYWKEQLGSNLPVLELPTDRPRPTRQQNNGSWEWVDLPESLISALKQYSREAGVSLFMTMLAGFNVLLSRYSGQEDICVGSPTANRNQAELERMIAFFVNPVTIRTDLSGDPTFTELVQRVRKTALGAFAHQEVPFERLVEALSPARDLSHHPLFQVSFTLQMPPLLIELPGVTATPIEFDNGTSKFDLLAELWEENGKVRGHFEYDTDLFDRSTIQRMIGHYQVILESVVANPQARISELALLPTAERAQLLDAWNDTAVSYPDTLCLHHLFEQQVAKTPDKIAVVFEDIELTYQQLNEEANQLAHHLQGLGIQPDQFVGICVERSLDMLMGMLGILKAGAAYLPMDPNYPQDRLAYMLEDTKAAVLVTHSHLVQHLPTDDVHVVQLDEEWDTITEHSTDNPQSGVQPHHLAYIIHTSGSTGKPKGVQIPHRNVVNFLETMRQTPGLSADDTLLAITTLSFDIAVLELYLPITTGATLAIASSELAVDGPRMLNALDEYGVTVLQATPATWQMLIDAGWEGDKNLKALSGGEALPRKLGDELLDRVGELWNMYGPTETTIWSSVWQVTEKETPILIGKPIANTQMYILDKNLQPVPIGVPGELHIGGDGVARGYLNRDDLTAERFLPNPFTNNPADRIYKTGDLARFMPNGDIECLGRLDFQVKVRGFRIELGEIEAVLVQHDSVRQGVVTAKEDASGTKILVAYVIPESGRELDTAVLRAHLAEQLPHYMIPSIFMAVSEYPLTPNGKVDRRALPDPDETAVTSTEEFVAPRNKTEAQLAQIWCDILQIEQVGIHNNFFEMGGHSLLAIQIISRIRDAYDIDISPRHIFDAPTIADLALYILEQEAQDLEIDDEDLADLLNDLDDLSEDELAALLDS